PEAQKPDHGPLSECARRSAAPLIHVVLLYPIDGAGTLPQSGLISAPRLPHALQTNRGSMSDSRTSSGQRSAIRGEAMAAVIVGAIDQDAAYAHLAHVAEGDLLRPHGSRPYSSGSSG